MAKERIVTGSKRSYRISSYLHRPGQMTGRIRAWYSLKKKGTIGFAVENVAGFGISSPQISEYTMNLYREVSLLEKAIDGISFKRSLEIGCGYGRITPWIARYSKEHHAIEPEPGLLKLAVKLCPAVKFHKAVTQNLPFPDDYFDFIVSFSVLHHVPPEKFPKAIQEIKRVAHLTATTFLHERVEEKGGHLDRSWPRSIDNYKRMFLPWKLTRSFDRSVVGLGKDMIKAKVMLFKGVTRKGIKKKL